MKSRVFVSLGLLILLAPGVALAQSKGDAKAGKAKYDANCVGCHGATGKGDGAAVKKAPIMPASGKKFSDQEVWDIVAYIRSLAK